MRAQVVEEVFRRVGRIWHVHVGGQVIVTTENHPFFVKDHGWLEASNLVVGDGLLTDTGGWAPVERIVRTDRWEVVYNLRVGQHHTYFVGGEEWGFSVWAHNACVVLYKYANNDGRAEEARHWSVQVIPDEGEPLLTHQNILSNEPFPKPIGDLDQWLAWHPKRTRITTFKVLGLESKEIPIDPSHAQAVYKYVSDRLKDTTETEYDFIKNSCFTYVAKVLDKAGLTGINTKPRTKAEMEALLQRLDVILKTGK